MACASFLASLQGKILLPVSAPGKPISRHLRHLGATLQPEDSSGGGGSRLRSARGPQPYAARLHCVVAGPDLMVTATVPEGDYAPA